MRLLLVSALLAATTTGSARFHIEDAENRRLLSDAGLTADLASKSPAIRGRAALALGRIGDPASEALVAPLLDDPSPSVRRNAAFALGLIGGDAARAALLAAMPEETVPAVKAVELTALGRVGGPAAGDALAVAVLDASLTAVESAGAAEGLGLYWIGGGQGTTLPAGVVSRLATLASANDDEAQVAAFALTTVKGDATSLPAADLLGAFGNAQKAGAQALLARVLGKLKTADSATALTAALATAPLGTRVEIVRALGKHSVAQATAGLQAGLTDASSQVVVETLGSIQAFGPSAAAVFPTLKALAGGAPSPWVQGTALTALVAVDPTGARPLVDAVLAAGAPATPADQVAAAAITALGSYAAAADLPRLGDWAASGSVTAAEAALAAIGAYPPAAVTADLLPGVTNALHTALARNDEALSSLVADAAVALQLKDFAPALAAAYPAFAGKDFDGTRMEILGALGALGDHATLTVVDGALADPDRLVALAAAAAHKQLTGEDVSAKVPVVSKVDAVTPPLAELRQAVKASVRLETTQGPIVLKMLPDAPLTAANFLRLVASGFYDGTLFHRVVPHFVVQGGDPRGDGFGGPGYLIREEWSSRRHTRGTVGIATDGKDTGGSQFFINHGPNLHLDGAYTVFATVTEGMDAADRLEIGDRILSATIE